MGEENKETQKKSVRICTSKTQKVGGRKVGFNSTYSREREKIKGRGGYGGLPLPLRFRMEGKTKGKIFLVG